MNGETRQRKKEEEKGKGERKEEEECGSVREMYSDTQPVITSTGPGYGRNYMTADLLVNCAHSRRRSALPCPALIVRRRGVAVQV